MSDAAEPKSVDTETDSLQDAYIHLIFQGRDHTGQRHRPFMRVPIDDFYDITQIFRTIGVGNVQRLIAFVDSIRILLAGAHITNIQDALQGFWQIMESMADAGVDEEETNEDRVLAFTYSLLRTKLMTHAQAAAWASRQLGQDITANAWRKRVDRWAKSNNLVAVEQRKYGRKPK